jgi:predicted DCC family thiol-disulfide oxidoreductase YuxK
MSYGCYAESLGCSSWRRGPTSRWSADDGANAERGAAPGEGVTARGRHRPVLVYDGDCAFCTSCARALERIGPDADIVAWQLADLDALGISAEQAAAAVRWVGADGAVRSGHEAIAQALAAAGGMWRPLARLLVLPGISTLAAGAYRAIAANRSRLPGATPACAGRREADGSACGERAGDELRRPP